MKVSAVVVFAPQADDGPELPCGSGFSPHARLRSGRELPVILHCIPATAARGEEVGITLELRYASSLDYQPLFDESFDLVLGQRVIGRGWIGEACSVSRPGPSS